MLQLLIVGAAAAMLQMWARLRLVWRSTKWIAVDKVIVAFAIAVVVAVVVAIDVLVY